MHCYSEECACWPVVFICCILYCFAFFFVCLLFVIFITVNLMFVFIKLSLFGAHNSNGVDVEQY